ncbi:MAG: hypothetical protein JWN44_5941 [Myxococcales bacterium]|nr:hypothetical protein [Myxococcales bacterium]
MSGMREHGAPRRIAIVTCAEHPRLYGDEQAVITSLGDVGVEASAVVWSDGDVRWSDFDRVVLRSTWDYFERIDDFVRWLDLIEQQQIELYNPVRLVRWNLDKRYLAELEARGVPIIPTRFIAAGERMDVSSYVRSLGWSEVILKPAISGAALRTYRRDGRDAASIQSAFDEIAATTTVLIQPFAPEIEREGEWSLVFFGGAFSHAVVKTPKPGDFRVQTQFGGTFRAVTPPPSLLDAARAIIAMLPAAPVYVRIDGIVRDDRFLLMEVEAIEPYLYMSGVPDALRRYIDAIGGPPG